MVAFDFHRVTQKVKKGKGGGQYNFLEVDETRLDIFDLCTEEIPEWEPPSTNFRPYEQLRVYSFDIETTGLDPNKEEIIFIGCRCQGKNWIAGRDQFSESQMIMAFYNMLESKKPDILAGFNNFEFDLEFIETRARKLGIIEHSPFWKSQKITTFKVAQKFANQPSQYHAYWLPRRWDNEPTIIDLYHQTLAWDYVARVLTSHNLKEVPLEMGLRNEARTVLSYGEMMQIWADYQAGKGDLSLLREYLVYDLEDTELLANRLIPSIWYQKLLLPDWHLQTLSTSGNATKWNSILLKAYTPFWGNCVYDFDSGTATFENGKILTPNPPIKFEGGYTKGIKGYYRNVAKIDVASLYPWIMLNYGLAPSWDTKRLFLMILKYLRDTRLHHKALGKTGVIESQHFEAALKIIINSGYGFMGSTGIPTNDFIVAAYITAYGRAIAQFMDTTITELGGRVIEVDTDGLIYAASSKEETRTIWKELCQRVPNGLEIEYEWYCEGFYNPPNTKKTEDDENTGQRKNYIKIGIHQPQKDGTLKIKRVAANGKYRKRDRYKLAREFQPEFLAKLTLEGIDSAKRYYQEIIHKLSTKKYPLADLTIKRKARSNEKKVFELGLVNGEGYAVYYMKDDLKFLKTKVNEIFEKTNTGNYSPKFYCEEITEQYQEIMELL